MRSAAQIINAFVDQGLLPSDQEIRALVRELGRTSSRAEYDRLDFKREFDNTDESWLDLTRHIAALANSGGGVLLFGLADDGFRAGLRESLFKVFDPTKIGNRIHKYSSGAQVRISYSEITYYKKRLGLLWVHPGNRLIIFDKTIQYPGTNKVALQQDVIYVRRQSSTGPATQTELNAAVDRVVALNLRAFVARIDHVASLPVSTQLVATNVTDHDTGRLVWATSR